MSDFLWELEKLRRRHGIDDEKLKEAVKELTRKPRGAKEQKDSEYLEQIRAGSSAKKVAAQKGLSDAAEIRIARKNRRAKSTALYQEKIEEFAELTRALGSVAGKAWIDQLKEAAAECPLSYLILGDVAASNIRWVLEGGRLSAEETDHVEGARFYLSMIDAIGLDAPRRRSAVRAQVRVLDAILQQLRAASKDHIL
jgi:hypothetical protein